MRKFSVKERDTYHLTQICLHWTIAPLAIYYCISTGGLTKKEATLCSSFLNNASPECDGITFNLWLGFLVFILMFFRLILRIYNGVPPLSKKVPRLVAMLARTSHILFYIILISMPFLAAFGWHTGSNFLLYIHFALYKFLVFLILIHICAVAFHEGVLG